MPYLPVDPGLRPFGECGYEVHGAAALDETREVGISSVDPMAPRLGDLFTVVGRGVVHEVAVVKLATYQGGWSVVCRVTDVF